MSNKHIENLEAMLAYYIEERRYRVERAVALRQHNGDGGMAAGEVRQLQDEIEGLERAIVHEKTLTEGVQDRKVRVRDVPAAPAEPID